MLPEGEPAKGPNMSTYLGLHYHLIFATKDRRPFFKPDIRDRVHEYLGGTVNGLGGESRTVGGVADHVHLLVSLRATNRLSDFLRDLKKGSSFWIKNELKLRQFQWQDGYAALTVSPSGRNAVAKYIREQEAHHRKRSFREEFMEILKKAEINYDPRFINDDTREYLG